MIGDSVTSTQIFVYSYLSQLEFKQPISEIFIKSLQKYYYQHDQIFEWPFIQKLLDHLKSCHSSLIRVKYLYILKIVLSHQVYSEDLQLARDSLLQFYKKLTLQCQQHFQQQSSHQIDFIESIELPYIIFLTKIINWKKQEGYQLIQNTQEQRRLYMIDCILQMKLWLKLFQQTYNELDYGQQILQWFYKAIKYCWIKILQKINEINATSIKKKEIKEEQYKFLKQIQKMQPKIHSFLNNFSFYGLIDIYQKLKLSNIIKPQVSTLYQSQKNCFLSKAIIKIDKKIQKIKETIFFWKRKGPIYQSLIQKE